MRHLIGFILAIVLGAALFFGAGWGFTHLTGIAAHGASLTSMTGLAALSVLAMHEHQALRWIPLQGHSFGAGFRALLVSGVLALLGAAMIIPLFIPARWRAAHSEDIGEDDSGLPVT